MALEHLEGTAYGPFALRISATKVEEYVAATGDDAARWTEAAPPAFAGALLFVAAPSFLHSEAVKDRTQALVHADQTFSWHHPLVIGAEVRIDAHVNRVRARGSVDFVTFDATVRHGDETWLESRSTFLLGAGAVSDSVPERDEPPVGASGVNEAALAEGEDMMSVRRSASRLDLVRYAAASGDFNPIHFDHATGVGAGFGGTIVHGLLMAAWMTNLASVSVPGDAPMVTAKYRFRQALFPGDVATVTANFGEPVGAGRPVSLSLREDIDLVTAKAIVRER